MGAGSSTEQRSPQDGTTAAGESQPGSAEEQPSTATLAEAEQPEEPSKLLHKNGQISSVNEITEEQVDLSLKPDELKEQQAEDIIADVGQRETANVILKEEATENMETKPLELINKPNEGDEQKDSQDADKQLPSEEKEEQPSESPTNDVGFKKVFKLVGFKFTVKKDKTENVEPVQLLNVKAEVTEEASDGSGDCKEFKTEIVEEATQSEVTPPAEKAKEETPTEEAGTEKEETFSEKVAESPVEAESKEAEINDSGNKSPESPVSPLTSETASPLRKFFTQGWAGFRKRTSFRKPKEELPTQKEPQEQKLEKEVATEGMVIKEGTEKEKASPEKDRETDIALEVGDEKMESVGEKKEETKMVEVSTESNMEQAATSNEQPTTQERAKNICKEPDIYLKEKTDLVLEEKAEAVQESLIGSEQTAVALSEEKTEPGTPLLNEVSGEKIKLSDSFSSVTIEKPEEPFEIIEEKSEAKAPLATETFDERPTEINIDSRMVSKKEEPKTTQKEQLVLEQLVETNSEIQGEQPTDEQLKVKETIPQITKEHFKQTDPSNLDAETCKAPEGITNEAELLSSQEKNKMQGSPLKKLFSGTSLKKLSGKKQKGKKEEGKPGESAEQIQQLSDSAESPEDPRAESSASSPEEATESVERVSDTAQITETEGGSPLDMEKKRESITPWASFKKMVTPKKRVRRLSESDKEDELDKRKSATLSSTESAPNDDQEDIKENDEEQKVEKGTDEPKRKADSSVSWEALICVGSSKKRTRKSSSFDEVGQRLAQDGQKLDEGAADKEAVQDIIFANSHESDQGQGSSSPEQAGSPSETEGVSTWESFKRLVTPRRKSKSRMEEKNDEPSTGLSSEHVTSDGDSGKEESWVSFKKLMPGRKKRRSDGIPEYSPVQETGKELTGTNEEDSDVPAVVPLSEYEAAEQEKFEAQKTKQDDMAKKDSCQNLEKSECTLITEQSSEGLIHSVTVTVVEGERAITNIEERSPSWISAAITKSTEHIHETEEKKSEPISASEIVEETVVISKFMPEMKKNVSGDTIISELELTSEAVTAQEETSGIEETTEISCAEETTEMVSAVSRLTESPDTTEIATPVQETEEPEQDLEKLNKQTQEALQVVAERVKLSNGKEISESLTEVTVQSLSADKFQHEISAISKEAELPLNYEVVQSNKVAESCEAHIKESDLKEVLEKSNEQLIQVKKISQEVTSLDRADGSHYPNTEEESVEKCEEIIGEQTAEEKSDEEFVIVTVTPEEQAELSDTFGKQQVLDCEEYSNTSTMQEIVTNLQETTQNDVTECVPEVDELVQLACEEKPQWSQKQEERTNILCDLESPPSETTSVEVKESPVQKEARNADLLTEHQTEVFVPEAALQSQVTEDPHSAAKDLVFGTETVSAEEAAVEACIKRKNAYVSLESDTPIQKIGSEIQLQKLESGISQVDVKTEPILLNEETQILTETVEKEISPQILEMDVHILNTTTEAQVINGCIEEIERKSHIQNVEAEVLVEKAELKVDVELSAEKAKAASPTEKTNIEDPIKEEEAQPTAKNRKVQMEVYQEKTDVKVDLGKVEADVIKSKIEEMQAEVLEEKTDATMSVEASGERVEVGVPVEEADTKVDVSISKKTDVKVETDVPCGKTKVDTQLDQPNAKLNEETLAMKVDIKSLTESIDTEAPKNVNEVHRSITFGTKHLTKETTTGSALEKAVSELAEKTEASLEKIEATADLDIFTEKVDGKADVRSPDEKVTMQIPVEQSDEIVLAETIARELEQKEALQTVMNEVRVQSEVEESRDSVATYVEIISLISPTQTDSENASLINVTTTTPLQREAQSALSLKSTNEENHDSPIVEKTTGPAVIEKSPEREPLHISAPGQATMDQIQKYVIDPKVTLELQHTEGIGAKSSDSDEPEDVTLKESLCDEEGVFEIPVQKELIVPPSETETVDISAVESLMQNGKEDAVTILEPKYSVTKGAEDILKHKKAVNSVKKELGNRELPVGTESGGTVVTEAAITEVKEDLLVSDSRFIENVVSDTTLENKRESALPDLKSENRDSGMSGISIKSETCPDKLPMEIMHSLSGFKPASESFQRTQTLPGKTQIMEIDKTVQNIELATGSPLYAAPMQELFVEKKVAATTDIPELQSSTAHVSSVTIRAAKIEEHVNAENVTLTETATEAIQSLLEELKEPMSKTIQQPSFANSESEVLHPDSDAVAFSEKVNSVVEESLIALRDTEEDLLQKYAFDSTLKMELPRSEFNEESEQKVMTPERSPATEFSKDVQSVTIESQSSKIVLKIIQNAVDKLEQTEDPVSPLKQSELCLVDVKKSGVQEDVQAGQQISVTGREEKNQEIQPKAVTAERKEVFKVVKEIPFGSDKSENGENGSSRTTGDDFQTVKEIVNETEMENSDSEPQFEMDAAVSTETQKNILGSIVSGDLPKGSVEVDQSAIKDLDAGPTVENQEKVIQHQTQMKRKYYSPSTECLEAHTEEEVNNQDFTSCECPQLQTKLTDS